MSLTLDNSSAKFQIRSYTAGTIMINDQTLHASVIVTPQQILPWPPQKFDDLTSEHFLSIIKLEPAILLIGTGERLQFPSTEIYGELMNHGIGVEFMDTSAACRTFNALAAEDRNVIAALLIA